ncbi:MAG: hypothetical protein AAF830_03880 [Pseudomonadota bacterium]
MRRQLSFLAALGLAACATTDDQGAETPAPRPIKVAETEAPDPHPLASFDIPAGRCGMTLWSASGGRIAPIFQSLDVTSATMKLDGEQVNLVLKEQSGSLHLGMRSYQVFVRPDDGGESQTVAARLDWGERFQGGLYIKGGTLAVTGADGWERVVPIAGIAGCKA